MFLRFALMQTWLGKRRVYKKNPTFLTELKSDYNN